MSATSDNDNVDSNKYITAKDLDLSCFKLLNHFRTRLYILREKLLEHVTLTQKDMRGLISWVEFDTAFHSHLVKTALALFNKPPLPMAKKAMFVFILEILNFEPAKAFFTQKNGAEKPQCPNKQGPNCGDDILTEAASTSTPAPTGQGCKICRHLFNSRKAYNRHTCVSREKKERRALPTSVPNPTTPHSPTPCPPTPCPPSPCPPTPCPPTPPLIITNSRPQTPVTTQPYVFMVTQYCRSCNQKHNIGAFPTEEVDPPGTELYIACPSRGHRLITKITLHPVHVESTCREPRY